MQSIKRIMANRKLPKALLRNLDQCALIIRTECVMRTELGKIQNQYYHLFHHDTRVGEDLQNSNNKQIYYIHLASGL